MKPIRGLTLQAARELCIRKRQILPDPKDETEKKWAEEGTSGLESGVDDRTSSRRSSDAGEAWSSRGSVAGGSDLRVGGSSGRSG